MTKKIIAKKNTKLIVILIVISFVLNLVPNSNAATTITYDTHSTQSRTKEEIIQKYEELAPKFDYSNSIYSSNPNFFTPFQEGKLQDGVVTDTLNQINYFRWLYGINSVSINQEKQDRSQKGAFIQTVNDDGNHPIDHTPSKPEGMEDTFYNEAYLGSKAGYDEEDNKLFNGNIDWGELSPTNSVKNFISDLYNISEGSWVGHRLNVLELEATEVSFGYCKKYTTLSMYYPYNANGGIVNTNNNDKFYAYPSAGYFPKQNFTTHEYWSFVPTEGFAKKDLNINDVSIEIEYDGKIYTQKPTGVEGIAGIENKGERTYPAIVFELPQKVIDDLGGAWQEMPVTDIGIEIKGLKDTAGNNLIYKYTVNFFDINENTDPSNLKLGDVNDDGKINARDAKLVMQHFTKKITLTEEEQKRAEVSGDGKINARDAKLIMQYFTKKIDKFPVEE